MDTWNHWVQRTYFKGLSFVKIFSPPADFQFEKLPEKCRERNVVITTTNKCYFDNKLSRHDGYQGEKIFSVLNQNFRFYRITQT